MFRYLAMRVAQAALTIFLTLTVVFLLIRLAPGDPAYAYAGPLATAEQLDAVREQMGLNQPLIVQYFTFLGGLFTGDIGESYSFRMPALDVVLNRMPYTITLAIASIVLAIIISIPLGVWMARHKNTGREAGVSMLTVAGQSMPDFWIGIMLIAGLAVALPWFPSGGFETWGGLVLPALTVAILQIAVLSRIVRREMVLTMDAPFITVARSRGISGAGLVWGYGLRNSLVPVVTALGTRFAGMLNGVVVVEVVFGWPGIGSLVVRALETRDYPLIQATVVVTAVLAVLVQLAVDLLYPLLDPRVRLGRKVAA
ncbi:MAG: ABC transporter permease [Arthrobacter sp.]|nr:ABC transporter permease [Arthrobacter sp.]